MMRIRLAAFPGIKGGVRALSTAEALLTAGYLGVAQLLRVMFVLRLGYGPEFVGALFAASALSFMLFTVPTAALGRRLGPRRMLLLGSIIATVGMAVFLLTGYASGAWGWILPLGSEVIAAAGFSAMRVNMVTAVLAVTTAETRNGAYALKQALTGLGRLLGTLVGGMLPAAFAGLLGTTTEYPGPYRCGLVAAVVLGLVSLVPLASAPPMPNEARELTARKTRSSLRPLVPLLACGVLFNAGYASCQAFVYAYMDRELLLPTSAVGVISALGLALAIPGALSCSGLARKRGGGFPMALSAAGLAVNLGMMALIRQWWAAGLGTVAMSVSFNIYMPAFQMLQMEVADPEWRWLAAGAGLMSMSLGFGLMSLAGGHIVAAWGYRTVFVLGALLALSSAVVLAVILHHRRVHPA